ncbi:antirestriction protein ArdA [Ornithinimicrobium sp. INDO-MA30-4]|uniref:antirestriction protein ArdA n=1 Tax=Ornithinimicrobium sp. INDO-MA30-4 TaxID=2908651 RepID=UPI0037CBF620
MTTRTNTDTTPRAWIGCLACYNNARLVGEWFDAETADEVTLLTSTATLIACALDARSCGSWTTRTSPPRAR